MLPFRWTRFPGALALQLAAACGDDDGYFTTRANAYFQSTRPRLCGH